MSIDLMVEQHYNHMQCSVGQIEYRVDNAGGHHNGQTRAFKRDIGIDNSSLLVSCVHMTFLGTKEFRVYIQWKVLLLFVYRLFRSLML